MDSAWILYCTRRATIHDISFYTLYVVQDATEQAIESAKNSLVAKGHIIIGVENNKELAYLMQDKATLQAAIDYIPFAAEGLANNAKRSMLVYITNKENSNLITYRGFYTVRAADYRVLEKLCNIRLATVDDVIPYKRQLLVVEDFQPFKETPLSHAYCATRASYIAKQIISHHDVERLITNCEMVNIHIFSLAVIICDEEARQDISAELMALGREGLTDEYIATRKRIIADNHLQGDMYLLQDMLNKHMKLRQTGENAMYLMFPQNVPELLVPSEVVDSFIAMTRAIY